uniref:Colicin D immunity protein domain-containing protein n=1 Tax=Fistulifera saprophila TaxID=880757 RepID=A0A8F0WG44_9STRA|nr:hypothetical protein KYW68_pgp068 [Fistulifera saprophila]YP_010133959.1 hypothetical protein KYW68_pgp014 [Fistulifera saprophila]QWM93395.1 hypothetical protein [Fistulifera saprophila]QWM93449.1 hypothetical protein [Fistulifera saprophila]
MENYYNRRDSFRLLDQILWQNRESYIELCEDYFSSKIDSEKIVDDFFRLHRNHNKEAEGLPSHPERLKKIQILSRSEGFTDLIGDMFFVCENLDIEETDDNSKYALSENRFRKELNLILQKLKNYS